MSALHCGLDNITDRLKKLSNLADMINGLGEVHCGRELKKFLTSSYAQLLPSHSPLSLATLQTSIAQTQTVPWSAAGA